MEETPQAATTPEGLFSSFGAEAPATVADQPGAESGAPPEAEGAQTDGADAPASKDAKEEGAPDAYEFVPPEGREFDPDVLGVFSDTAKELNLSQEKAQKMLDRLIPALVEKQARAFVELKSTWVDATKADAEVGGSNLKQSLADGKAALDEIGTPALRGLLKETGLDNHPEIIRLLVRTHKVLAEDKFIPSASAAKPEIDFAKRLYPSMN